MASGETSPGWGLARLILTLHTFLKNNSIFPRVFVALRRNPFIFHTYLFTQIVQFRLDSYLLKE